MADEAENCETLEEVIIRYFPETAQKLWPDLPDTEASAIALRIMEADFAGSTMFERWDAGRERKLLRTVRQSLRKAVSAYKQLSPVVRAGLFAASRRGAVRTARLGPFTLLRRARDILEQDGGQPFRHAQKIADAGLPAGGQRDWHAVAVVDSCREVWTDLTGNEPRLNPRRGRNLGFIDFLEDVINALGLKGRMGTAKSVRSALKSWRDVYNLSKKSKS